MSENLIGFGSSIKNIQESQPQQTQQQRRASKEETATIASIREQLQLSQRCVIIQKDENGLGLRVSGDNPVFVESVRSDGAAYRAGVRAGDQIIKVNGTLVTKYNHSEVNVVLMLH
ncbi:Rho guanine nucleotide exchange factor 12-like protein [Leptotrombidium deliense]|uniref:Rho guanine nucleotide exchange factor 12-like protein n=1 Tax=Leptotrombidium deliense TaxID=299467 RepID=A0A443STN2_9ACAR|nr:Rho guanine nucleotide exchange factor 12-like protein [Leptotrombidium deliense]